jgi:hypothetical protein
MNSAPFVLASHGFVAAKPGRELSQHLKAQYV